MSSSAHTAPRTYTFFGATGGCALACLQLTLKAGYQATALVRSEKKLRDMLGNDVPTNTLRIVEGNALNSDNVRDALLDTTTGAVVDTIIYGLGMRVENFNILKPNFPEPTLCHDTMKVILDVLAELAPPNPPFLTFISTTGIDEKRDVPILFWPLYHYALKVPHIDKGNMEKIVEAAPKSVLRNWVAVRPSLFMNGDRSYGKIKVGYEGYNKTEGGSLTADQGGCGWKSKDGTAIGYLITRNDVGSFIFEESVVGDGSKFWGKKVTLTS